jgi:hypothetical protein
MCSCGALVSLEGPDELLRNREEIYQVNDEEMVKIGSFL